MTLRRHAGEWVADSPADFLDGWVVVASERWGTGRRDGRLVRVRRYSMKKGSPPGFFLVYVEEDPETEDPPPAGRS